jgi:hypothetical protein
LPIRLDHGCAAKTWATAPPLKPVVLTGSLVSGARKIRWCDVAVERDRHLQDQ